MKALVLSGGGALGAYEAGVIKGLYENGERFDLICGTSIGALNAAFVAQGKLDALDGVWKTIGASDVIKLLPIAQRLRALFQNLLAFTKGSLFGRARAALGALVEFVELRSETGLASLLGAIDPKPIAEIIRTQIDFGALKTALIVSGTNLTDGTSDAFYWFPDPADGAAFAAKHDKGTARALDASNLLAAVQASTSIPFAFAPIAIAVDGETRSYVDGGVANNTPIGVAIDAGATEITLVFMNPPNVHTPQPMPHLGAVGLACFNIMQERILELDFSSAKRVNAELARGSASEGSSGAHRPVLLCAVRPVAALQITVLQFDQQKLINTAYALGYADGRAHTCPIPVETI